MKPQCASGVFPLMADIFDAHPNQPLYRAIPVLEAVDDPPHVILDALAAHAETSALLDVLPGDPPSLPRPRNPVLRVFAFIWRCVRAVGSMLEWLFGVAVLMIGLAVLAALPVFQFLSLGYLLESAGGVARTGRLRDGFIGVRLAARLGGGVLGCWLLLLPVRLVADLAYSAQIIDSGRPHRHCLARWPVRADRRDGRSHRPGLRRGGRLRYFFWPFNFIWVLLRLVRGGYYAAARDAVWDTVVSLRLPHYFSLGFRGFVGALTWLALPVTLLALGQPPLPRARPGRLAGGAPAGAGAALLALLADAPGTDQPSVGGLRGPASAARVPPGAVGLRLRLRGHAAVRRYPCTC